MVEIRYSEFLHFLFSFLSSLFSAKSLILHSSHGSTRAFNSISIQYYPQMVPHEFLRPFFQHTERLSGKRNFIGHVLLRWNFSNKESISQQKILVKSQYFCYMSVYLFSDYYIIVNIGRNKRTSVL